MSTNKKLLVIIFLLSLITFVNTPIAETYTYQGYVTINKYIDQRFDNISTITRYSAPDTKTLKPTRPNPPSLSSIVFSDIEFVEYFDNLLLPNTTTLTEYPSITGNHSADQRIIQLATQRGYQLRPVAINGSLSYYNGFALQSTVITDWNRLATAAREQGYSLAIVSGYRSPSQQRTLFIQRLQSAIQTLLNKSLDISQIANGTYDAIIDSVLSTSSIPGTSKHHTGYAIDITDLSVNVDFTDFGQTKAYEWLSQNNYANVKRFGFLPSYPNDVQNMGPDPEAWEFVWVGNSSEL